MKTTIDIKKDIAAIGNTTEPAAKREREKLTQLLRYIETNPSAEAIQKQLNQVQEKIKIISERFDGWKKSNYSLVNNLIAAGKSPVTHYNNIYNLSQLRDQEQNLKYLLS